MLKYIQNYELLFTPEEINRQFMKKVFGVDAVAKNILNTGSVIMPVADNDRKFVGKIELDLDWCVRHSDKVYFIYDEKSKSAILYILESENSFDNLDDFSVFDIQKMLKGES